MIKRKDLADISDKDYGQRRGEYLVCKECGNDEIGGTRGDYFTMIMDAVFSCPACGSKNMALARNITTQEIIKQ